MSTRKPKDLHMGEIAYNCFYKEKPQVFFDDLNFEAQMKWVTLCRTIVEEYKRSTPGATLVRASRSGSNRARDERRALAKLNGGGPAVSKKSRRGFIIKPLEQKVKEWDEADEKDKKLLTDKVNRDRRKEEVAARGRMWYREKQREKYGLKRKHDDLMR